MGKVACLDHVFSRKRASYLVNSWACYETELVIAPATQKKRIAVEGGRVAGLVAAMTYISKQIRLFPRRLGTNYGWRMTVLDVKGRMGKILSEISRV